MLVIGHRGSPCEGLENSFDSFYKAVEAQCDIIEIDLWGGKDHSLWLCHDEDLTRTTNSSHVITKLTREELKKIKLKNKEPLPELKKVLDIFLPQVQINIELKDLREEISMALIKELSLVPLSSKVIISCFNKKPLELIEREAPNLQLAFLWENDLPPNSEVFNYLEKHPKWFFHPQANTLKAEDLKDFQQHKRTVYPWVPRFGVEGDDKEKLWKTMEDFKVHGLCTNYPREFKQWLKRRKKI